MTRAYFSEVPPNGKGRGYSFKGLPFDRFKFSRGYFQWLFSVVGNTKFNLLFVYNIVLILSGIYFKLPDSV